MQLTRMTRSKWFLPLFSVALGLAFFAAQWIGGDARERGSSRSGSWPPSVR